MRFHLLLALSGITSFMLASGPSVADTLNCDNASTTVQMIQCADTDLQSADQALNDAYRQRRNTLDQMGKHLLRDAQRAWIKFRDAQCACERDGARRGTMAPLLDIACREYLTRQRTHAILTDSLSFKGATNAIYWLPGREATGAFQCGLQLVAKVGLAPRYVAQEGRARLFAHIQIGDETVDMPIDDESQDALCGTDITLSAVDQDNGCTLLRVDDGMCDAAYVGWRPDQQSYRWERLN